MDYKNLIALVKEYREKHSNIPNEKMLCDELCRFILINADSVFDRNNLKGHITAGGIIVCGDWVLMNHHKILNNWIGFGGHAEAGETDPFLTACREVREESGIEGLRSNGKILDIEKFTFKHDETGKHTHFDIRYLFVAKSKDDAKLSTESDNLKWMPIEHAIGYSSDFAVKKILNKYKKLYESRKKNTPIEDLVK